MPLTLPPVGIGSPGYKERIAARLRQREKETKTVLTARLEYDGQVPISTEGFRVWAGLLRKAHIEVDRLTINGSEVLK
jgi:hypothetical protein